MSRLLRQYCVLQAPAGVWHSHMPVASLRRLWRSFNTNLKQMQVFRCRLKPRQGVTSLEQLVRETNKKEKEKKNQAEKRERAVSAWR